MSVFLYASVFVCVSVLRFFESLMEVSPVTYESSMVSQHDRVDGAHQ